MTIDRPATSLEYRPTARVFPTTAMREQLDALSEKWPQYTPVVHRKLGTADQPVAGYVRDDTPASVPHTFDGRPRRVCIDPTGEVWVSVIWHPGSPLPKRAWQPASLLEHSARLW